MHFPQNYLRVNHDTIVNIWGLCIGDFNESFDPHLSQGKSLNPNVELINSGNQIVVDNQTFDLPVRVVNNYDVGAVSLILNFPANLVQIEDVVMNSTDNKISWNVNGSELRIGWFSAIPMNLNASDILFTLKLKTLNGVDGSAINFTLSDDPSIELADGQYDVITPALLSMDAMNASATSVQEQSIATELSLNAYPNPFNGTTVLTYDVPFEGKVTLKIYNYLGECVKTLTDEDQTRGIHSLQLDGNTFAAGIYMATLKVNTDRNEEVRTIKIVNNR
jgi:hypothetical protein